MKTYLITKPPATRIHLYLFFFFWFFIFYFFYRHLSLSLSPRNWLYRNLWGLHLQSRLVILRFFFFFKLFIFSPDMKSVRVYLILFLWFSQWWGCDFIWFGGEAVIKDNLPQLASITYFSLSHTLSFTFLFQYKI